MREMYAVIDLKIPTKQHMTQIGGQAFAIHIGQKYSCVSKCGDRTSIEPRPKSARSCPLGCSESRLLPSIVLFHRITETPLLQCGNGSV